MLKRRDIKMNNGNKEKIIIIFSTMKIAVKIFLQKVNKKKRSKFILIELQSYSNYFLFATRKKNKKLI